MYLRRAEVKAHALMTAASNKLGLLIRNALWMMENVQNYLQHLLSPLIVTFLSACLCCIKAAVFAQCLTAFW